jgi:hypothetical protein
VNAKTLVGGEVRGHHSVMRVVLQCELNARCCVETICECHRNAGERIDHAVTTVQLRGESCCISSSIVSVAGQRRRTICNEVSMHVRLSPVIGGGLLLSIQRRK